MALLRDPNIPAFLWILTVLAYACTLCAYAANVLTVVVYADLLVMVASLLYVFRRYSGHTPPPPKIPATTPRYRTRDLTRRQRRNLGIPQCKHRPIFVPPPPTPGGCWSSLFSLKDRFYCLRCPANTMCQCSHWLQTGELQRMIKHRELFQAERKITAHWFHDDVEKATIRPRKIRVWYHPSRPLAHVCAFGERVPGSVRVRPDDLREGYAYGSLGISQFFDTPLLNAALGPSLPRYLATLRQTFEQSPYAPKPELLPMLDHAGILRPALGSPSHPHAVHVALERQFGFMAARMLGVRDFMTLFMRESKIQLYGMQPLVSYAPSLEAKDLARYNLTLGPGAIPAICPPTWYMHDALQHLSPRAVGAWFDAHPELKFLVCTAIIPPESRFGLPSAHPGLYTLRYRGDTLFYTPEGDAPGTYAQPLRAHKWLSASTLITPNRECLHVGLVHSRYAHHLFVISRPEIVNETQRFYSSGRTVSIPFQAHPWGTVHDRLTDPVLYSSMVQYAMRVKVTDRQDLYAKIISYSLDTANRYPDSAVHAAVLGAYWARMTTYHATPSLAQMYWMKVSLIFDLPFLPLNWMFQSMTAKSFSFPFSVPDLDVAICTPLAATHSDDEAFARSQGLCPKNPPFWWIPMQMPAFTGLWVRFAVFNSLISAFFLVKILVIEPIYFVVTHFPVGVTIRDLWHVLDLTPLRLLLFSVGVFCIWFLRLFPIGLSDGFHSLHDSIPYRPDRAFLPTLIATAFGLPSSPYRSNGGHLPFTQVLLGLQVIVLTFPRALPHFVTPYPAFKTRDPKVAVAATLLLGAFAEQVYLFFKLRGKSAISRPWHLAVPDLEQLAPPLPEQAPEPPLVHYPGHMDAAPPPSPPLNPQALPQDPPEIILPQPAPDAAANLDPPAYEPDPLGPYRHAPETLSLSDYRRILLRLPIPAAEVLNPDAARMCVWDVIGQQLGIPPRIAHAVYLANLGAEARAAHLLGEVPLALLSGPFAFFGLGVTVHRVTHNHLFNPAVPPVVATVANPGFPSPTLSLYDQGHGNIHITSHIPAPNQNAQLQGIVGQGVVGVSSRRVTIAEASPNLQMPTSWQHIFDRLSGLQANSAAVIHELANAIFALPHYVPLPATLVRPQVIDNFTLGPADVTLRENLARDLKQYPELLRAIEGNPNQLAKEIDVNAEYARNAPIQLILLNGAPGSGKSYYLRSQMATWLHEGPVRIHCWNSHLRGQLVAAFRPLFGAQWTSRSVCTGMTPLYQMSAGTLILDDAGMLYPGMIPLIMACNPALTRIVVTYDTSQTRPPFPNADALTRSDMSTCEWLDQFSDHYGTVNRRLSLEVSDLFGLPRAMTVGAPAAHGNVFVVSKPPRGIPLFVTSPRFAESKTKGGTPCYAMADAQGLSIEGDIAIDLGGLTSSTTDSMLWMTLTRGTGSIFLVLPAPAATSNNGLIRESPYVSGILNAILAVSCNARSSILTVNNDPTRLIARAVQAHLSNSLSPQASGALGLGPPVATVAGDSRWNLRETGATGTPPVSVPGLYWTPLLERAARGDTYTPPTHAIDAFSRPRRYTSKPDQVRDALKHYQALPNDTVWQGDSRPAQPAPEIVRDMQPDPALNHREPRWQLGRERYVPGYGATAQARPDGSHLGLTHQARDAATERLSLLARITPALAGETRAHRARSVRLMHGLRKFVAVPEKRDMINQSMFDSCLRELLTSWLRGRSMAQILAAVRASPPDWDPRFVKLFLKSQRVKKIEKATSDATKGQIVTNISHIKLFRDSVWALYLERSIVRDTRSNVYLHARSNLDQMQAWYSRYWDTAEKVTYTDYTGWDVNVDEAFTLLYANVMRAYGVPSNYVSQYVADRHTSRSFMGPMPAMQFSGDRYTWLLNTVGNMALTGESFDVTNESVAAFSGDDMIICGQPKYTLRDPAAWKFQPKLATADTGEFCGFMFGHTKLHVSANVLHHRGMQALEDGRLDEPYWQSYEYALSFARSSDFYPDPVLAAAIGILDTAKNLMQHRDRVVYDRRALAKSIAKTRRVHRTA